ncbi:MAG: GNAT family N-acetyltransferase [Acidimicrobiia bacterium]
MTQLAVVPPALAGYEWRAAGREDAPAIQELYRTAGRVDGVELRITLEDLYRELAGPAARNSLLALTADGRVAAYGVMAPPQATTHARQALLRGEVEPAHRGLGLGSFVLAWLEARAAEALEGVPGYGLPKVLRASSPIDLADRIALLEGHEYRRIRYWDTLRRDLSRPFPEAKVPPGLELLAWSRDWERSTMRAWEESFAENWGHAPATFDEWQPTHSGDPAFREDLSFLMIDGAQVAGFSLSYLSPEENAATGIEQGWIGQIGVRHSWRRRGLGTALVCRVLRAFREEALDYATLDVDVDNPARAHRLYQRLGFERVRRTVFFAKQLQVQPR